MATNTKHHPRYWSAKRGQGQAYAFLRDNQHYSGPECLTWPFSRIPAGYGMLGYLGETLYAHRFMCELVNGPPPTPQHEAAHSCGRGKFGCVDPRHLSWKTISENAMDCREHGTQARNKRGNRGHLTDKDAEEIKSLKGYLTQAEIARMFNTSEPTVRDITSGRSRANRKLRKPLTDEQVREIRTSNQTPAELVRRYKVGRLTIRRILMGTSYKDVSLGHGQLLQGKADGG